MARENSIKSGQKEHEVLSMKICKDNEHELNSPPHDEKCCKNCDLSESEIEIYDEGVADGRRLRDIELLPRLQTLLKRERKISFLEGKHQVDEEIGQAMNALEISVDNSVSTPYALLQAAIEKGKRDERAEFEKELEPILKEVEQRITPLAKEEVMKQVGLIQKEERQKVRRICDLVCDNFGNIEYSKLIRELDKLDNTSRGLEPEPQTSVQGSSLFPNNEDTQSESGDTEKDGGASGSNCNMKCHMNGGIHDLHCEQPKEECKYDEHLVSFDHEYGMYCCDKCDKTFDSVKNMVSVEPKSKDKCKPVTCSHCNKEITSKHYDCGSCQDKIILECVKIELNASFEARQKMLQAIRDKAKG